MAFGSGIAASSATAARGYFVGLDRLRRERIFEPESGRMAFRWSPEACGPHCFGGMPVIGIVFAIMTGLWCLGAHWLVNHRALGLPIRTQAHRIVPLVLIGLGILIFIRTGAIQLFKH